MSAPQKISGIVAQATRAASRTRSGIFSAHSGGFCISAAQALNPVGARAMSTVGVATFTDTVKPMPPAMPSGIERVKAQAESSSGYFLHKDNGKPLLSFMGVNLFELKPAQMTKLARGTKPGRAGIAYRQASNYDTPTAEFPGTGIRQPILPNDSSGEQETNFRRQMYGHIHDTIALSTSLRAGIVRFRFGMGFGRLLHMYACQLIPSNLQTSASDFIPKDDPKQGEAEWVIHTPVFAEAYLGNREIYFTLLAVGPLNINPLFIDPVILDHNPNLKEPCRELFYRFAYDVAPAIRNEECTAEQMESYNLERLSFHMAYQNAVEKFYGLHHDVEFTRVSDDQKADAIKGIIEQDTEVTKATAPDEESPAAATFRP